MAHIFISHSQEDYAYAQQLAAFLREQQIDVWIAESGEFDEQYAAARLDALRRCAAFLLIMTPAAKRSSWVQTEMVLAETLNKLVLPLVREGFPWPRFKNDKTVVDVRHDQPLSEAFLTHLAHLTATTGRSQTTLTKSPGIFLPADFLVTLSRRLRTPLNGVLGFTRVLLDGMDGSLNEAQRKDLHHVYNSGLELLALIQDLFDVVRLQSGPVALDPVPFDVTDTVRGVMSQAVRLVEGRAVQLKTEIAADLPRVLGDPLRTRQALLNIVGMVCEATFEGEITLALAPATANARVGAEERPVIEVAIRSSGMTIAETNWARLFEAFQLSEAHNMGLRLPLAKALIELQGGEVRVKSHPHEGTTFTVMMPVAGGAE